LTDIYGKRITYNREEPVANKYGLIASRLRDHMEIVEKLNLS